ncbi:hypothetical protein GF373_17735 [bacterium]|nr:hypothetical protein [bacterium]
MPTRKELLEKFESSLNGWLLRADAYKHPYTKEWIQRYPQGKNGQPPKAKVLPDLKSAIIEVEAEADSSKGRTLERHICFFVDADREVKANCQFYVINRGQKSEDAWWLKGGDPKPTPPEPNFQQQILTWLRGHVGITVQGFVIEHIHPNVTADEVTKTATARALGHGDTGAAWLDVFLSQNDEGDIQVEVLEITRLGA